MAVLKLFATNPTDGIASFDKIKFYEATDAIGTGSTLITTIAIDLATADINDAGYTVHTYPTADLAKYYAATYYNSVSFVETNKGAYILGARDRVYDKFQKLTGDTTNAVFENNAVVQFREDGIEALFPELQRQVIDETLEITKSSSADTLVYTIPFGLVPTQVWVGDANDDSDFVQARGWSIEGNKLRFDSIDDFTDEDTIRLIALKKFTNVGEVPEKFDSLLLIHMQGSAYRWMASRYPRYEAYSQLQKGTKVSFENLDGIANKFFTEFDARKLALARTQSEEEYA